MTIVLTYDIPLPTKPSISALLFGWVGGRAFRRESTTRPNSGIRAGRRRCAAFSLEEVVVSMAISALSIMGISGGYIMSAQRAEWSGCSQAANAMALQGIEQARAARWDTLAWPSVDEVVSANFPVVVQALALPATGTNVVCGTNVTTISTVSVNPPVKMIRSQCTWRFMERGVFTNTLTTYRSPDQ